VYLISRVLRAPPGVVVVDEPEVHFHALLARTFWDTLQTERDDCRFVFGPLFVVTVRSDLGPSPAPS
jgi:hypothetical protein